MGTLLAASSLILPASIAALLMARRLNLLQLGDEEAHYLGINVPKTKRQLLLLSAVLVGAAVASKCDWFYRFGDPPLGAHAFRCRSSLVASLLGVGRSLFIINRRHAGSYAGVTRRNARWHADQFDRRPLLFMADSTSKGV